MIRAHSHAFCRGCALAEKKCSACGEELKAPRSYIAAYVKSDAEATASVIAMYGEEKGAYSFMSRLQREELIRQAQRQHNARYEAAHLFFDNDLSSDETPVLTGQFLSHLKSAVSS